MPPALRQVAAAFFDLQAERHIADYDNHGQWSTEEVQENLDTARDAFRNWQSIRDDEMAGNYLLMMLLPKPRS